jgi:beta-glucosidase
MEGEEGDAFNSSAAGDKPNLRLPGVQEELLECLAETGKPLIVVLLSGSALDLRKTDRLANALMQAWYPGQDGGMAVAEVLFGSLNPAGRLPVTFVQCEEDLPPFESYAMKGRTYRFLETPPLYPFGFGLSYTSFEYTNFKVQDGGNAADRALTATVTVTNVGDCAGDEVVQFYLKRSGSSLPVPNFQLCGFKRIRLLPGETKTVAVGVELSSLLVYDNEGRSCPAPGLIKFYAGGQQPDARSQQLTGKKVLAIDYRWT